MNDLGGMKIVVTGGAGSIGAAWSVDGGALCTIRH